MAMSLDKNRSVMSYDKISKYMDLEIETGKMWYLKITVLPIIIGTLVMITKDTAKQKNEFNFTGD